ncbi:MAG: DMT family transporter [Silicimonas sp.]|nr:DMT family transporter [Silicimonas sp.]
MDGRTGALVVVTSFAGLFWLIAPFAIEWHWFGTQAALVFAFSGLLVPGLAQQFHMLAVEKLGPTLTSVVAGFVPVFAILPAVLFLEERLNAQAMIGIAVMIAGVILSVRAKTRTFGDFALTLLAFPLIAAVARGLGQPISKFGLSSLPEPFFATLVMVSAATVFIGTVHLTRDRATIRFEVNRDLIWLVLAGFVLGLGFLSLYAALNRGDVVVVAPFIATVPIWVVLFDHFIFKHDRIGKAHVVATLLATLGAIVLITR